MTEHPTPWRVQYWQPYPDWNEKSRPKIVDAAGKVILHMPQNVEHPGIYDELADKTAHQIVAAVNREASREQLAKQVLENSLSPTVKTPRKPVINE